MAKFNSKKNKKKEVIIQIAEELIDKLGDEYTFRLREDINGVKFIVVHLRYPETGLFKIYDIKGTYDVSSHIVIKDFTHAILATIEYNE